MPRPYASAVINASADQVWSYIRDFANIAEWLPPINTCEIEDTGEGGGGPRVGAVRRLTASGDAVFRERLVALSDADRSLSYEFVESPLPVRDLRATMRVAPVTDTGQAFVEWWGDFDADAGDEEPMKKFLTRTVYSAGLDGLRKHFG
ncbi:MAG: hypothetical protein JWO67_3791 [Streptosporangiaceae bacterium]|jgi:hypothetical protein|nr:hypothetical protein [Streptosporangiaceae bacterium]